MGYTAIEKILMNASGRDHVQPGDIIKAVPSFYLSHDNTGEIINKLNEVEALARKIRPDYNITLSPKEPGKIVVIFDHTVGSTDPKHAKYHEDVREFAKLHPEINFYDDKAGVCHQVFMEEGYAQPGSLVIGADSHSTLHGAANAAGIPINRTEMAGLWLRDWIELKVPETMQIELLGKLNKGVYSKDLVLYMLSQMSSSGARYKSMEYIGEGIKTLSMSERMTITNMGVEFDAKNSIMPYDETLIEYLSARQQRTSINPVVSDSDANIFSKMRIDMSELEAMIAQPHHVDNVVPISQLSDTKITHAYLGSCTNGRFEDLVVAARILEGRKINSSVNLAVYPASKLVEDQAKQSGIYQTIIDSGANWMIPACGPCFGAVGATLQDGDVCISSSNRNFKGRMGSPNASVYLASPATVAASAISGYIMSEGDL